MSGAKDIWSQQQPKTWDIKHADVSSSFKPYSTAPPNKPAQYHFESY